MVKLFQSDFSVIHTKNLMLPIVELIYLKQSRTMDVVYFDHILIQLYYMIQGHHAEIWCLAVSPSGNFVVTGSHDRSLRLWEKTDEPLVLDEEKEMV